MARRNVKPRLPDDAAARRRRGPRVSGSGAVGERGEGRVRLHKALAAAGIASRRACERLIAEGRVRVNRQTVTSVPAWVDPERDRLEVDGRQVVTGPAPGRAGRGRICIVVNKPRHVLSTTRDPEGRRCVLDLVDVPARTARRLFPVGRLDAQSTGLILLTNDGELAQRLTHPRYGVPKSYRVSIRGTLGPADLKRLTEGLYLARRSPASDGKPVRKAAMSTVRLLGHQRDRERGDRTLLQVTLREGQNREIRRMLARLGFDVRRLERVAIGPLRLRGLARGEWRILTGPSRQALYRAAGLHRQGGRGGAKQEPGDLPTL